MTLKLVILFAALLLLLLIPVAGAAYDVVSNISSNSTEYTTSATYGELHNISLATGAGTTFLMASWDARVNFSAPLYAKFMRDGVSLGRFNLTQNVYATVGSYQISFAETAGTHYYGWEVYSNKKGTIYSRNFSAVFLTNGSYVSDFSALQTNDSYFNGTVFPNSTNFRNDTISTHTSQISTLQSNDTVDRTYVNNTFLPIATYGTNFPNNTITSKEATWDTVTSKTTLDTVNASAQFGSSAQVTGLDNALSGKEGTITGSTGNVFWNGLKTWVALEIGNITGLQGLEDVQNTSITNLQNAGYVTNATVNINVSNATGTLPRVRADPNTAYNNSVNVWSAVQTLNGANLAGTAYQSQSFQNLLKNGDFESWSAGAAADPDNWTIGGGGAAIARESIIVKRGTYSAKITNGLDTIASEQYLAVQTKTGIGINYFKNRTITFGAWVYSATANRARVWIQDDVQPISYSSYHTGDSTWQFLTTTFTVDNTATLINVGINISVGSVINIYGDGAILVEGSVCPAFMPHPTDTIPIVLGAAPTDVGTNGETRWYAVAGAGGARRLYMSNGTDWKYQAIAT